MKVQPIVKMHSNARHYLSLCRGITANKKASLKDLMQNSLHFPIKFPLSTMTCHKLLRDRKDVSEEKLEQFASSAYPLLHESAFYLFTNFLEFKKQYGTEKEKQMYFNMGVTDLVERLLNKRAVVFYGTSDVYLLIDGKKGTGGWKKIGKDFEDSSLSLENCLSYDEIKLSTFLSVSSHSFFINDGNRYNQGIPSNVNSFQHDGVIIGLIGARLEKPGVMEWEEIIISKSQNITSNGYGSCDNDHLELYNWRRLWADFYGLQSNFPLYREALSTRDRYTELEDNLLFDDVVFKRRIAVSAETLLLDAESRAAACNMEAYVRVVGIGLGVWRISSHQEILFLETFSDCLKRLFPVLPHVSDVHFLWFDASECGGVKEGEMICKREDGSGIRINFSREAPHSLLKHNNKLLVASYAWDGNALPGNEFWEGCLSASGDPAEACSSQVAELHNPHINRSRVRGECLHVASPQMGVLHVAEYANRKMQEMATK